MYSAKSSRFGAAAFAAITLFLSGCARDSQPVTKEPLSMDQVKADLLTISQARVFFGHQSVGNNILAGIRNLAEKTGTPLRIAEVAIGAATPEGPGLFHSKVGENLDPDAKITGFAQALGAPGEGRYDVATFKFCYVDLDAGSKERSPDKLFERYASNMSTIEAAHPGVRFLHATMPLTAEPPGKKTKLKRLLGMSTSEDAANVERNKFNQLARQRYTPDDVIDIARFESTRPDNSIAEFRDSGRQIEMLALEYTSDGGHLNELGQERVAAAFLRKVADALRARQTGQS